MKASENKWLSVASAVKLTPIIEPVIVALDAYFAAAKTRAIVTSGLRDANDQLRVVRSYLVKKGLDKKYPNAMTCKVTDEVNGEYAWQMAWSNLLNVGIIINPPLDARTLMPYKGKTGQMIHQTPHARGTAFDVGGGNQFATNLTIIKKAVAEKLPGLKGIVPEPQNNAIHIDCKR